MLLQTLAPVGVLASPGLLTVPGAGASREPLDAMQFNVPGFGDLSEAVNVANGNLYLSFDGISHNNQLPDQLSSKNESLKNTIASSGWNIVSRLRLDGFDPIKALASFPPTLSLASGDSSVSSYAEVTTLPTTAPDWISRYSAVNGVRYYQLGSEPGKSFHSSWIVLLQTSAGRVIAHAYGPDGTRSTFNQDGEYVDYSQTVHQQYRSALAGDPEGAAVSPKTEMSYLPGTPGLLGSIVDEWGRTTRYDWDPVTKVVKTISSAYAEAPVTVSSTPGRQIKMEYAVVGGQTVVSTVTYRASDGLSNPAAPVLLDRAMTFTYLAKVVNGQTRALLETVTRPVAGNQPLTGTYSYDVAGRVVGYSSKDAKNQLSEPVTSYKYDALTGDTNGVQLPAVATPRGGATSGGALARAVLTATGQYVEFTSPRTGTFDLQLEAFGADVQGFPSVAVTLNGTPVSQVKIDQASVKVFNLGSLELRPNDVIRVTSADPAGRQVSINNLTLLPSYPDASNRVTVEQGGKTSSYVFDQSGQLIADFQLDHTPLGGTDRTLYHRYRYYPDGNLGLITDGYQVGTVFHDGKTVHMAYDAAGNMVRQAEYATPQNFDGSIGVPVSLSIGNFKAPGTIPGVQGIVQVGQTFELTATVSGDPGARGVVWYADGAQVTPNSAEITPVGGPEQGRVQDGQYTVRQQFSTAGLKAGKSFTFKAVSQADPTVTDTYVLKAAYPARVIGLGLNSGASSKIIVAPDCLRPWNGQRFADKSGRDQGCQTSLDIQPEFEYAPWANQPAVPQYTLSVDPESAKNGASVADLNFPGLTFTFNFFGVPQTFTLPGRTIRGLRVPWKDLNGEDRTLGITVTTDTGNVSEFPVRLGYFGIRKMTTGVGYWDTDVEEFSTFQYGVQAFNSPDPNLSLVWSLQNYSNLGNGCLKSGSSGGFWSSRHLPGSITAYPAGYPQLALRGTADIRIRFGGGEVVTAEPCIVADFPGGLVRGYGFSNISELATLPVNGSLTALSLGTLSLPPIQPSDPSTGVVRAVKQVLSSNLQPGFTHYESFAYDASNRLTGKTAKAPMTVSAGGLTHQYQDVSDRLAYSNFSAVATTPGGKQTFVAPETVTTTHAVGSSDKTTSVATLDDAGLLTRQKLSWGEGGIHYRQTSFVYLRDRTSPTTSYNVPSPIDGIYYANSYAQFQVRQYGDQMYWRYDDTTAGDFQHSVQYFYDQFGHAVREIKYGVASGLSTTPVSLTTATEVVNRAYDGYDNQFWSQTTLDSRVTHEQGWSYDAAGALHSTWLGTPSRLTTYSYDAAGRLNGEKSGIGDGRAGVEGILKTVRSTVDYALDDFGRVREQKVLRSGASPAYDTTKFTYDTLDRVASKTLPDASASVIKTWYDDLGQQRLIQEPYGAHSWRRDTLGRVLEETVTPAAGHGVASSTSFTYDPYGRVVMAETADTSINSGASDRQTVYRYDSEGREVLRIGAAMRTVADASGTTGNKRWLTDARRPSAVTGYDELGRKTSLLTGLYSTVLTGGSYANPGDAARTSYSYDDLDRLIGSTDAEGYETRLSYDGADRLTKTERQIWTGTESTDTAKLSIDKTLYATSWTISLNDQQPLVAVDPTGARVERRYNRAGDLTADLSQQQSGGEPIIRHAYTYTADGLPLEVWEPKSGTAPTTFNPYQVSASFDATSTNTYNTGDLPSSTARTVNDGTTATSSFEYTWQGKPSKVTAPDASVTSSEYDYLGNVTRMTDRNDFTTESIYDASGHQLSVKQLARSRTQAGVFDGDEIDKLALLSNGLTSTYTYDADGNLTRKNERHLITDYVYNSLGKVIAESRPTYRATEPVSQMNVPYKYYAYRLDGLRVAETTASYTDGGQLQTAQAQSGGLTSDSVSATGQKSGGLSVTRYDLTGRVTRVTHLGYPVHSTGSPRLTETDSTFVNNGLGLKVQRSFTGSPEVAVNQRDPVTGGFITRNPTTTQTYWTYNERGDLLKQWAEVATPTNEHALSNSFTYTYSPTGKRLSADRDVQVRISRESQGTRLDSDPLLAASVGRVESDYNERDLLKTTRVFDQSPTTISSFEAAPTTPQRTTEYAYYPDGSHKSETTGTGSKTTSYDLLGRPVTVNDSNGSSVPQYTADQNVPDGARGIKVSRKVGTGAATITYAYTNISTTVTTLWASPPKGATAACSISRTTIPTVGGLTYQEVENDSCDPERASLVHTLHYTDRGLAVSDQTSTTGSYDPGVANAVPARPLKGESFNVNEILYNDDNTVARRTIDTGSYVNGYAYNHDVSVYNCYDVPVNDPNQPGIPVTRQQCDVIGSKNVTTTVDDQNTAKIRTENNTFSSDGFLTNERVDINDNTCPGGFLSNGACVTATSSGKVSAAAPTAAPSSGPVKVAIVAAYDPNHITTSYVLDSRGDRLSVKGGPNEGYDGYIKRYDVDGQVAMFFRYDQDLKRGSYSDFVYDPEGQQVLTANSAFINNSDGYILTRNQSSTYSADGEVQLIRKREGVLADTGAKSFLGWEFSSGQSDSYATNDLLRDQTYSLADGLADVTDWNAVVLFDSKAGFNAPIVFQAPVVSTSSSTGLDPATVKPPAQVTPPATSPGSTEVTPPVAPPGVKPGSTGKAESVPATTGSIGSGQAAGTVVTIGTVSGTTPAMAPVKPVASAASGSALAAPVTPVVPAQVSGKDASGVVLLPPQNVLPPSAQAVTVQEVQAPGAITKTPVPVLSEAGSAITAPNQVKLPAVSASPQDAAGQVKPPNSMSPVPAVTVGSPNLVLEPPDNQLNRDNVKTASIIVTPLQAYQDQILKGQPLSLNDVRDKDQIEKDLKLGKFVTPIEASLSFVRISNNFLGPDTVSDAADLAQKIRNTMSPEKAALTLDLLSIAISNGNMSSTTLKKLNVQVNHVVRLDFDTSTGVNFLYIGDYSKSLVTDYAATLAYGNPLERTIGGAGFNAITRSIGLLNGMKQGIDQGVPPAAVEFDVAFVGLAGFLSRVRLPSFARAAVTKVATLPGCNSFTPNTPVRTLAGLMAIGTLTIGTQVLAFNEQTGQNEYDPITAVHRNIDPAVTYLTLKDGKTEQAETITTTPEHPFYLQAQADAQARPRPVGHEELNSHWVGAGHLQIGDKIKQANGSMGTVANVVTVQQTQEMFNLTVGKAHTFYVGDREWLVHNTYCGEIIYGALDSLGRPTGVVATVTKQMIGTGTDASGRIIPPGYVATATNYWSRGHLLANLLGGSGDIPENLVTLVQNGANSPVMSMLENSVRKHIVETGNSIKYTATPIYEGASLIPRGITISAEGKGFIKKFVTVLNVPMR